MRLIDIENQIKKMISEDINNPDIYTAIFDLVYKWFLRNKIMPDYDRAREVATLMAEDLWFRLFDDTQAPISSWIGYISKSYRKYLNQWLKENNGLIDVKTDDFEVALVSMYASSTLYDDTFSKIYSADCLRAMPKLVDQVLEDSIFYPDTKEWLNAKTTLLLSVLKERFISYNQTEEDAMYTRILYRIFLDKLAIQLHPEFFEDITKAIHFYVEEQTSEGYELWTY